MYITPTIGIHSNLNDAKQFADMQSSGFSRDEKTSSLDEICQSERNLIIGEPGAGKTLLLERIKEHLDGQGLTTTTIRLRNLDAAQRIDQFLTETEGKPRAVLLDALDETPSRAFSATLEKLQEISRDHPGLRIYLSARLVFVSRYFLCFPEFRFITIAPFSQQQVSEYLLADNHSEQTIEALWHRVMVAHEIRVIQIPRYLSYLSSFLKQTGIDLSRISRNQLFEYFIYHKLELEDETLKTDNVAITKRILEKLALTMEIFQTNVLTTDEFMTFLDDLDSDLKRVATTNHVAGVL